MTDKELTQAMISDYKSSYHIYEKMYNYYIGKHDIVADFQNLQGKCNSRVVNNFVKKFINEEINYTLGNALSLVSKSSSTDIISAIDSSLYHWKINHNSEVMKQLEIFGKVYLLNYIDVKGRFCERILTPKNAIAYTDDDGNVKRFIHFYKKPYDNSQWYDIYCPNGVVEIYKDDTLVKQEEHHFKGIPVSVCKMDDIYDTIYFKIKSLQDAYNLILSTQVCTIADYRNAYLVASGMDITEEDKADLKREDLINLPQGANLNWLIKEIDASGVENTLNELKYDMYVACNHIDGNEGLPSNTSGVALRSRLVFLEQIAKSIYQLVEDAIYDRFERLFEYLDLHNNVQYDVKDIKINFTPNIPQDAMQSVQIVTQLGDKISNETALSLLPFIENPQDELVKIKAEQSSTSDVDVSKLVELLSNMSVNNE